MNDTIEEPLASDAEAVNALLRGELAAVEVYTSVLGIFADEAVIAELQAIRADHRRAVRHVRDCLVDMGAHPADGAGVWGGFGPGAGQARALGPAATLALLQQAEENAITTYAAALERAGLSVECLRVVQTEVLPACRRHVEELNRLLGGTD
jgi:hypothetical protein